MLLPQFRGAQGNLGARLLRFEWLEWFGHYDARGNALGPRRGPVGLGRILRRNFLIRGRTTAGFPVRNTYLFSIT